MIARAPAVSGGRPYFLTRESGAVRIGTDLRRNGADADPSYSAPPGEDRGTGSVGRLVDELEFLRRAVASPFEGPQASAILLAGLENALSIDRREATFPAAHIVHEPGLRGDLARQAIAVGRGLTDMAREAALKPSRWSNEALSRADIRSPCEGHVWTADAAGLLMGASGGARVMQLYNEWLHRLVMLRNLLIPYVNWRDVPVPAGADATERLRAVEPRAKALLADAMMGRPRHEDLVALALAGQNGAPSAPAYGFQTRDGLALPAAIAARGSAALLTWHPATLIESGDGPIAFLYADPRYFDVPRRAVGPGDERRPPAAVATGAHIVATAAAGGATLALHAAIGGCDVNVELGRIVRGARHALAPPADASAGQGRAGPVIWHDPSALIAADALVTAGEGIHACPGDGIATLALLGSLYPDNVVQADGLPLAALRHAGKGYGPLFLIGEIG